WLMPPAQAWQTLRYSSTLKILAPSLLSQKGKGWTTFTPPAAAPCRRFRGLVSHRRSHECWCSTVPIIARSYSFAQLLYDLGPIVHHLHAIIPIERAVVSAPSLILLDMGELELDHVLVVLALVEDGRCARPEAVSAVLALVAERPE